MRASQQGIALVSVLWVLALLSVIAAGVAASTREDLRLAGNLVAAAQARAAAEGGVQWTLHEALAGRAADTVLELNIGDALVRIAVADEAGKIDLNAAPASLLEGLLKSSGLEDEVRRRVLDAILDWRDADSDVRPDGAEDAEYRAAGLPYGAKNAPFDSVDELSLVLGVSPQIYQLLKPALTVYSRQPRINPAAASRQVLLAVPGANPEEVERYLELRERNRQEGVAARTLGNVLSLHAQARMPNGATAHVTATVELRRPAFTIRDWRHEGAELF
jgi:general secretion pathway protein K